MKKSMKIHLPKTLVWIILLSLLLHVAGLAFVIATRGPNVLVYGDAHGYILLAEHLREGLGFVSELPQGFVSETFRTPGLPLLLYFFISSSSGLLIYLSILTSTASLLLPFLTWWIGLRLFNQRTALIAAGIMAFEPMLIFFSWFPLTEIPFLLFLLASIAAFLKSFEEKNSLLWTIFAGALAGYSILIRPSSFLFFVGTYVVLVIVKLKNKRMLLKLASFGLACAIVIFPWSYHVHKITGSWAVSGTGWSNVYADYLSSIRSLKNGTTLAYERNLIYSTGAQTLGLGAPEELFNPANSRIVRNAALSELWSDRRFVAKLEPILLFTFFTNDGWYYSASTVGLITRLPAHISPTGLFLNTGFSAFSRIWQQLAGQFFVPVIGRIVELSFFLLALIGTWRGIRDPRFRVALLLSLFISLAALGSTALGFGVEARLRISVMPLIFLLAALGADQLLFLWSKKHTNI
jgi:4-amino-4-deoxy-L-arabinose transferase-like glycosyltransferase